MGPTSVLSAPDGPHVGPMNLAIRVIPPDLYFPRNIGLRSLLTISMIQSLLLVKNFGAQIDCFVQLSCFLLKNLSFMMCRFISILFAANNSLYIDFVIRDIVFVNHLTWCLRNKSIRIRFNIMRQLIYCFIPNTNGFTVSALCNINLWNVIVMSSRLLVEFVEFLLSLPTTVLWVTNRPAALCSV